MSRPNGAALYGAWIACVIVASRCGNPAGSCEGGATKRGILLRRGGKPHDAASLSRITRIPENLMQEMLDIVEHECKWLDSQELRETPQEGAGIPQEGAASLRLARARDTGLDRTGQDCTEQYNTHTLPLPTPNGGLGVSVGSGSRKLNSRNGNGTLELQNILNKIYGRKEGSRWSYLEECAIKTLTERDGWREEIREIQAWKPNIEPRYFPKLLTLLTDWPGQLDRARKPQIPTNNSRGAAAAANAEF